MNYCFKFVENNEETRARFVDLFVILKDVLSAFALVDNDEDRVNDIKKLFEKRTNNIFDMVAHIKLNEGYDVESNKDLSNVESTYNYDDGDYVTLSDD